MTRRALFVLGGCAVLATVAVVVGACSTHQSSARVVRVLQMNLCDSGIAGCYTGRSVARAEALVRTSRPDVVTLNEVCRDDLAVLARTLSGSDEVATSAFRAAVDRGSGRPVRCRNGQEYGVGVLTTVGSVSHETDGGIYPMQDTGDVEERVWVCVHADVYACTTHLTSTSTTVAFEQCRYLLRTAIPGLLEQHGSGPVVLAGDLNLRTGRAPDPRSCVPSNYVHADDGSRQHVLAGPGYTAGTSRALDMAGTTDHPGLLVDLSERG